MIPAFESLLDELLPPGVPERPAVCRGAARHLARVLEANEELNLTRIREPRAAVLKHVVDSLLAAPLLAGARTVLDLGTGAGFPGLPLALSHPGLRFFLVESAGKKARLVASVVEELGLPHVSVHAVRAEHLLREQPVDVVLVRGVAAARDVLRLLKGVRGQLRRLLLYKGPEARTELEQAARDAARLGFEATLHGPYDLPEQAGRRFVLEYAGPRAAA